MNDNVVQMDGLVINIYYVFRSIICISYIYMFSWVYRKANTAFGGLIRFFLLFFFLKKKIIFHLNFFIISNNSYRKRWAVLTKVSLVSISLVNKETNYSFFCFEK